jgi:DNA-directed RNA polymerase subunit RPC12/RpoP
MLRFACPKCRKLMSAYEEHVGETVACPHCEHHVQVPNVAPSSAPPVPPMPMPPPVMQFQAAAPMMTAPVPPPPPVHLQQPQAFAGIGNHVAPRAIYGENPAFQAITPTQPRSPITGQKFNELVAKLKSLPLWFWAAAGGGACTVLLCAGLFSLLGGGGSSSRDAALRDRSSTSKPPPAPPKGIIESKALFKAYQDNEIHADEMYKDREITVRGMIDTVGSPGLTDVVVYLVGGNPKLNQFTKVQCNFDERYKELAKGLVRGQVIVVKGTCRGRATSLENIILDDCEYVGDR